LSLFDLPPEEFARRLASAKADAENQTALSEPRPQPLAPEVNGPAHEPGFRPSLAPPRAFRNMPGTLPPPLGDPLRGAKRLLGWLAVIDLAILLVVVLLFGLDIGSGRNEFNDIRNPAGRFLLALGLHSLFVLPVIAFFWRILPARPVNAFYLRSFRNDRRTWPLRKAAQAALGRAFRLSGIRDPSRRWPVVVRYLALLVFVLRYCTPKFMNLEAGADWKARLWRSLADARCVLIDIGDVTPFVEDEIHLCHACLGLGRILFVGDASRSRAEWVALVADILALPEKRRHEVNVALWSDTPERRQVFSAAVRAFASRLPRWEAGLREEASSLIHASVLPEETTRVADRAFWVHAALGVVLVNVLVQVFLALKPETGAPGKLWYAFPLALNAYVIILVVNYLFECGSNRERVMTLLSLALVLLWLGGIIGFFFHALARQRDVVNQMVTATRLSDIARALDEYQRDTDRSLPAPAITGQGGRPLLSWRVALLPYLDQADLYSQFHLDEPWDSPHNSELLARMPEVFALPGAEQARPGMTYFQVFVGPGTPFEGPRGAPGVMGYSERSSHTILLVEAADPIPWTKPEDLRFDPDEPLPKLGGHFEGGFQVVFADRSVRFVRQDVEETTLRALITGAGAQNIDLDLLKAFSDPSRASK
jgi:hypothetical protein